MLEVERRLRRRSRLRGERHFVLRRIPSNSFGYGMVPKRTLYDTGITLRNEMPDLDASGRAIYVTPLEHTGRRERLYREREEERRAAPCVSKKGVRGTTAVQFFCVMTLVLGMIWLVCRAQTTTTYKQISDLQRRIEVAQEAVTDLEEQYATAAASIDVGYKAVDLGMISTKNTSKIYLYVPAEAENGPPRTTNGLYASQLAAITGD